MVCCCSTRATMVRQQMDLAAFQPNSDGFQRKLRRMEGAVRTLLEGIGEDSERQGLQDTPKRVAKALISMTEGYRQAPEQLLNQALFDEPSIEAGAGGLVLVRDIDFASLSQDTLLPFYGRCHIAYVPSKGVVLGLSKLARLTKLCAKQLQTQESLARHVLHVLQSQLQPLGAVVVVQARHLAYTAAQPPKQQLSAAASGCLALPACKAAVSLEEALDLLGLPVDVDEVQLLQDPSNLLAPTCTCGRSRAVRATDSSSSSSSGFVSCYCSSSRRLEPSILRGISASAGGLDSPRAPITPDPSENDDSSDSSEQGSDLYCQQLLLSSSSLLEAEAASAADSMEGALHLLLAEAGVDVSGAVVQAALRRHVLALLAATSGYHQKLPSRWGAQQAQPQLLEHQSSTGGCACCSSLQEQHHHHSNGVCSHHHQQQPVVQQVVQHTAALDLQPQQLQRFEHHIPFMSQCEHHMLPFHGTVHITYLLPDSNRDSSCCHTSAAAAQPLLDAEAVQLVHCYTKRLQVQERITHQVATAVQQLLQPAGVMVVINAVHMCMVARGVENHAGSTSTRAAFGVFEQDTKLRCKFLRTLTQRHHHHQQQQQQEEVLQQ